MFCFLFFVQCSLKFLNSLSNFTVVSIQVFVFECVWFLNRTWPCITHKLISCRNDSSAFKRKKCLPFREGFGPWCYHGFPQARKCATFPPASCHKQKSSQPIRAQNPCGLRFVLLMTLWFKVVFSFDFIDSDISSLDFRLLSPQYKYNFPLSVSFVFLTPHTRKKNTVSVSSFLSTSL